MPSSGNSNSHAPRNHVDRTAKFSTPVGTCIFILLRILDPALQYLILTHGWGDRLISALGGTSLPLEGPPVLLNLPFWRLTLFTMTTLGAVKAVYYLVFVSENAMPVASAIPVGLFKTFLTNVNTLLFCATGTSAAAGYVRGRIAATGSGSGDVSSSLEGIIPLLTAIAIFTLGISCEAYSEIQRKNFKADPTNQGKPYTAGLFALARHVNYGGFTIWKMAYGLACAGWVFAALSGLWMVFEFERRSIPPLDKYCQKRYGAAWTEFKQKTPRRLIPFIY